MKPSRLHRRRLLGVAVLALSLVAATSGTLGYRAGVRATEATLPQAVADAVSEAPTAPAEVVYRYVVIDPDRVDPSDRRWADGG